MTALPLYIAPSRFDDAEAALTQVRRIYDSSIAHLRDTLHRFVAGEDVGDHVRACYPFVRVHTSTVARADSRVAYGFVAGPGVYEAAIGFSEALEQADRAILFKAGTKEIAAGFGIMPSFMAKPNQTLPGTAGADTITAAKRP